MTLKPEIPLSKPRDKPGAEEGGSPKAVSQHDLSQQGYKVRFWGMLWKKKIGLLVRHCPFSLNCKISKPFTN